jgi:DNA-binding MarR family transcriptional regulator
MTQPEWLDEREAHVWRTFRQMNAELLAHLGRRLVADSGLSEGDYGVLVHLSEAPEGRLRAFELVAALQWEKSRLSHHLRRMEGRGLVERHDCTSDARGAHVQITDLGRSAIGAAAPQHVADVRRYFIDALTPEQQDMLSEISETVLARLGEDRCP